MSPIFACPRCRGALSPTDPDRFKCIPDKLVFPRQNGIWRFLLPERQAYFERFIVDYAHIRAREQRGAADPKYYQELPFRDHSNQRRQEWAIRAATYTALLAQTIQPLEVKGRLSILDLGAGNGWLSNQLAGRGHAVTAVDLQTDARDGLGATAHYTTSFHAVQAEFDRLPLADHQFDGVIFNASFHYSEDYPTSLAAALAAAKTEGFVAILDTPIYTTVSSGTRMVVERQSLFEQLHGTRSDALASENFLTWSRIDDLAASANCRTQWLQPAYPRLWRWRRRWIKVRGGREPATFGVLLFQANHSAQAGERD